MRLGLCARVIICQLRSISVQTVSVADAQPTGGDAIRKQYSSFRLFHITRTFAHNEYASVAPAGGIGRRDAFLRECAHDLIWSVQASGITDSWVQLRFEPNAWVVMRRFYCF